MPSPPSSNGSPAPEPHPPHITNENSNAITNEMDDTT